MNKMRTNTGQNRKERFTLTFESDHALTEVARKEPAKRPKMKDTWLYLGLVGDMGFAIALPIAGGAFLGSYLDRKLSTYPKATLLLIVVGILISISGLIRILRDISSKKD